MRADTGSGLPLRRGAKCGGHHGRLTHAAYKDEHHGPCEHRATHEGCACGRGKHSSGVGGEGLEIEGLGIEGEHEDADKESEIGESGHDKCLLGC